jgi:hypothetical protein
MKKAYIDDLIIAQMFEEYKSDGKPFIPSWGIEPQLGTRHSSPRPKAESPLSHFL